MPAPLLSWNENELRLLRTVDLFQQKPGIMKKAEEGLIQINLALQAFLKENPETCPTEADCIKGQIARGENNKGFPFISLDMPQLFSKEIFFSYRILFWWGHYLGFSLILKGGLFEQYQACLQQNASQPTASGILFSVSESPWEWGLDETAYLPLNTLAPDAIAQHCNRHQFIKLLKVFPMEQTDFPNLDWTQTGLSTYRELIALISD